MNEIDYDINSLYADQIRDAAWIRMPVMAYELNDSFEHEGTKWYQLKITSGQICTWIETHDEDLWWENTPEWKDTRHALLYTVHEKLYTYICLKWG